MSLNVHSFSNDDRPYLLAIRLPRFFFSSFLLSFCFFFFFLLCCPLHRIYRSVERPRACVNDGMTLRLRLTSLSQRGGLPRTRPLPLVNFISRSLLLPVPDQTLDTRCSRHESFGIFVGRQTTRDSFSFFFFFHCFPFERRFLGSFRSEEESCQINLRIRVSEFYVNFIVDVFDEETFFGNHNEFLYF